MPLNINEKKAIVADVNAAIGSALSAVVADSCGVSVAKMTELRKETREAGVYMKVVSNTLARRAVEGTNYDCLKDVFSGPTLLAFSNEHPGAAARIFKKFAEENQSFSLKGAAYEGKITDLDLLARLPTYDEAIASVMMCLKEASAGKLVRTLAAVKELKESQ